ncbi:MAG TPA: hypothetical protein VJS38_08920 [Phenylobacterium sp.]|uniref:hypothetical protein n=1 Tax=Phenylobacterium sp. TaxID=1871053 RepID=UPI002B4875E3|nr:hypothetical protein [Phenylobacterium sp.]HKR88284.1 hypothetical protein [Phenylobacterium sp.]
MADENGSVTSTASSNPTQLQDRVGEDQQLDALDVDAVEAQAEADEDAAAVSRRAEADRFQGAKTRRASKDIISRRN